MPRHHGTPRLDTVLPGTLCFRPLSGLLSSDLGCRGVMMLITGINLCLAFQYCSVKKNVYLIACASVVAHGLVDLPCSMWFFTCGVQDLQLWHTNLVEACGIWLQTGVRPRLPVLGVPSLSHLDHHGSPLGRFKAISTSTYCRK